MRSKILTGIGLVGALTLGSTGHDSTSFLNNVHSADSSNILWTMVGGAIFNLANLLLVKNSKRVREVALRSALGAGYWRLARQFLTETLILALAGGCLGLILAQVGLSLLVRNAPIGIPRVDQIRLDSTTITTHWSVDCLDLLR